MISQPTDHILLLLYLTPYVHNLTLQVLIRDLHEFSLRRRPISLPLLVMRRQLIFLYKLQQLNIVTCQLDG